MANIPVDVSAGARRFPKHWRSYLWKPLVRCGAEHGSHVRCYSLDASRMAATKLCATWGPVLRLSLRDLQLLDEYLFWRGGGGAGRRTVFRFAGANPESTDGRPLCIAGILASPACEQSPV